MKNQSACREDGAVWGLGRQGYGGPRHGENKDQHQRGPWVLGSQGVALVGGQRGEYRLYFVTFVCQPLGKANLRRNTWQKQPDTDREEDLASWLRIINPQQRNGPIWAPSVVLFRLTASGETRLMMASVQRKPKIMQILMSKRDCMWP